MNWLKKKTNILKMIVAIFLVYTSIGLVTMTDTGTRVNSISVSISNQFDNYYLDNNEILKLVTDNENRKFVGSNVRDLDLRMIEKELLNEKFIKNAEMFIDLKGNATVSVELRRPIARIIQKDGPDAYIDIEGEILPVSEQFTSRVLLVSGEKAGHFITNGLRDNNEPYFQLIKEIHENLFWKAQIAQVDITEDGEVSIYPQVTKQKIIFGMPDDIDKKFRKLMVFYKEILPAKSWNHYSKVDLRFENQIICQ